MPYDIFDSVAVQIGTYGHDNNSIWQFSLYDASGNVLYQDSFNASQIEDNGYYRHKIKKRLGVRKGDLYYFSITAKDVSDLSKFAFYASSGDNPENTALTYNGQNTENTLCFKVYGGDKDHWWHGLITFVFLYVMAIIWRLYAVERSGNSIKNDTAIQAMLLGAVTFLLLFTFAFNGPFIDENDNLRGGLDVPLHPAQIPLWKKEDGPASFARMYLYYIHCFPQGSQILSDGFEGLMFTVLMLEFLRYYKDKNLNWGRSIIVSLCIWGSFGAAFVSAYALIFLALIF